MTNPKGSFIWYELMTGDPDGAARFYGAVVGWTIAGAADPAAPGGVDYRMIGRSDGGNAGGMLALNADMLAGGARPGWLGYLYTPDVDAAGPGVAEPIDPVRGKDQIQVEGAILELNEVLSPFDFRGLLRGQAKSQIPKSGHERAAVRDRFLHVQICILRGIRKAEENRARLSDEQIPAPVARERLTHVRRLLVVKRGHSQARTAAPARTTLGTPPSSRTTGMPRHPARACGS